LHIAAYVAEIVRAGIESIRPGQVRAALALGMSRAQIVRKVVLPQALVRMLPAFGSILSITIKDTAIATVIAVPELMKRAETLAGQSYRPIEIFSVVAIIYFIILFRDKADRCAGHKRVAHLGRSLNLDWSVVGTIRRAAAGAATVLLTVLTMTVAVPGGIVLAVAAVPLACCPVSAALSSSRNLPLILVVYWAFYVMPVLLHVEFSPFTTGLVALCLNVSAYNAETFRAGINSIRKGQMEAAVAIGMSRWQAMKQIIVPQAWRRVLPYEHLGFAAKEPAGLVIAAANSPTLLQIRCRVSRAGDADRHGCHLLAGWLPAGQTGRLIQKKFEVKE
jgi:polar amino acid transport system permease protein